MENIKDRIKSKSREMQKEIRQRTVGYILAAFGLVAGLAWNEAIKSFIEYLFPLSKNTFLAKLIYALVITFALVIISIYLTKLAGDNREKK
jgi:hypothetical protein